MSTKPHCQEATAAKYRQAIHWLHNASVETSKTDVHAADLSPWLQLTTSLTKALAHEFAADPGLIVLGEGVEQGHDWERESLGASDQIYARHIALTIDQEPVVLARSVTIPGVGMEALTNLRNRPLAELLFEDPQWRRNPAKLLLRLGDGSPGRGCFWQNQQLGAMLVVQEFFLENFVQKLTT